MADSSDIDLACDPKLSAKEVVGILQRDHALPAGRYYDVQWREFGRQSSNYYNSLERVVGPCYKISPYLLSDPLSDVCRQLRGRILKWLCNSSRGCSMFWITDPLVHRRGPTVAQGFTAIFTTLHRLGSHSQITARFSPQKLVLQVVVHLASQYPPYRRLLIRELFEDPIILKKSHRILFKRLIVEPWDTLAASHPIYLQRPPLIILEFIWGAENARGSNIVALIKLVQKYSSCRKTTPLLWLICIHPNDRQLNHLLSTIDDVQPIYGPHEVWTYDSTEATQDVNDILHHGFQQLHYMHFLAFVEFDENWPPDAQIDRLASVICGVPHFACAVIQFVSAKGKDPKKQLETCIQYMSGCPPPSARNPFSGLDHFYRQFLANLPSDAFNLLSLSLFDFNTCFMANLLRIDRIKIYDLISDNLDHLLTLCPCENSDYGHELQCRDTAFEDFFEHETPAGTTNNRSALLMRLSLRISSYGTFSAIVNEMTWKPSRPGDLWEQVYDLRTEVYSFPWLTALDLGDGGYDDMSKFDFRKLVPISAKIRGVWFYRCLLQLKVTLFNNLGESQLNFFKGKQPEDGYPLVRTEPIYPSDHDFIEKCKTVAVPLHFHCGCESPCTIYPQYTLAGHGIQTVLVILCWDPDAQYTPNVNIYSLDMLDDL